MVRASVSYEFVENIPERIEEGMVYVSIPFTTAIHKCCCGCAQEVVTPLSPTDWCLTFDGASISLDPSIGNWSFPCQSHYWITENHVHWAPRWSRDRIERGRAKDRAAKRQYFGGEPTNQIPSSQPSLDRPSLLSLVTSTAKNLWHLLRALLKRA